jgi:hypothetical protein
MKLPHLASSLLFSALLSAPVLHAQTTDFTGNVSPVNINLTIRESSGGYLINEARRVADFTRGFTYPELITYDTTYLPDQPAGRSLLNPFGWDSSKGGNYVERVSSKTTTGTLVVTAEGSQKIATTRYTNATLLADLVAAGRIPSVTGYRIVAVRADTAGPVLYDNGTYPTQVNSGLYFFAEKGLNDPAPVFLGAETDVYDYPQLIDFEAYETAQAGAYTDTFTGTDNGFAYGILKDQNNGVTLGEFTLYRPASSNTYYKIRAGGPFNWSESYDVRAQRYRRGAINGTGLSGPARVYTGTNPGADDTPTDLNQGIVTGNIALPAATQQLSVKRYLDQIPPVAP